MNDPYSLQRFLDAQNGVYNLVLAELRSGRKKSHWIWFVFPQIRGLGHSAMAQHYAITSLDEAEAYMAHHVLGARLRECTRLVINTEGRTALQIFGHPDNLKFRSSMTLFLHATKNNRIFQDALVKYYEGKPDQATLDILQSLNP